MSLLGKAGWIRVMVGIYMYIYIYSLGDGPPLISWFINPNKYSDVRTTNHSNYRWVMVGHWGGISHGYTPVNVYI